jgi:ribose transport system ATP-binding protein
VETRGDVLASSVNAVEMIGITKSFFGTKVLNDVNFSVKSGEIHALAGENGAGKSTLMKILQGVYKKDDGVIRISGNEINLESFSDALSNGIGMVFQEFSLVPDLTVAQNIFLNREPKSRFRLIADLAAQKKAKQVLANLELDIDVTAKVKTLGRAYQQLTEIAKAISFDAKVLILDEPTASLAKHEVDVLFRVLKKLTAQGVAIIYVSHRMDEIFNICDRISVLRDGKMIATSNISEISGQEIISQITGRNDVEMLQVDDVKIDRSGTPALHIENLSTEALLKNINLKLFPGEILGLAGLMGSGRTELLRAIFGMDKKQTGQIYVQGEAAKIQGAADAMSKGLAFIPEDRRRQGLVMEHTVTNNILATNLQSLSHLSLLNFSRVNTLSKNLIKDFEIRPAEGNRQVKLLSGGNQQKVVIAKWMATNPAIVLMDEPTVGVDIGTKVEIMKLIRDLAAQGKSVLLVSSELPELLSVCHRILIMKNGEIKEELMRSEIENEEHLQVTVQGIK